MCPHQTHRKKKWQKEFLRQEKNDPWGETWKFRRKQQAMEVVSTWNKSKSIDIKKGITICLICLIGIHGNTNCEQQVVNEVKVCQGPNRIKQVVKVIIFIRL